jgi:hypothetical protein
MKNRILTIEDTTVISFKEKYYNKISDAFTCFHMSYTYTYNTMEILHYYFLFLYHGRASLSLAAFPRLQFLYSIHLKNCNKYIDYLLSLFV